jgi:hypothetical protein
MDQIHLSPLVDQIQLTLGHISNIFGRACLGDPDGDHDQPSLEVGLDVKPTVGLQAVDEDLEVILGNRVMERSRLSLAAAAENVTGPSPTASAESKSATVAAGTGTLHHRHTS